MRSANESTLPEGYKELCDLCRGGKLFAVQDWFKIHIYWEPEHHNWRLWPLGIAIEKGFHSLVEVLLRNGIPANARAVWQAARLRKPDIVELLFQFGATVDMVDFKSIVSTGDSDIIRMFIDRGADLTTDYPFATGLIRQTRQFLGIYKSTVVKHPELQFQADLALRHFCEKANLRGVSLLMWLGANPRAAVPRKADESEDLWESSLDVAVTWSGNLDIIKRLKPDPSKDDVNELLLRSMHRQNMDLVRYWTSLGADMNFVTADGETAHKQILSNLTWELEMNNTSWIRGNGSKAKQFTWDWFSSGAKWSPKGDDLTVIRKALSRLSHLESYELIKLLLAKQVMSAEELGNALDCPKLRASLQKRHAAIAALIPHLQKWIKPGRAIRMKHAPLRK